MLRYLCLGVLAVLMVGLTADTSLVGQDKVERRDRKTEKAVTVTGKILDESIAGVKVKVGGVKEETVPASDIQRIYYDDVPVALKQAYYNLFLNEEKEKDLNKMLKDYQDFYARASVAADVRAPIKRYLEYRIVSLRSAAAETEEAKADARRALETFVAANKASWEYAFAARTLARMHLDRMDFESAVKTLNDLAGNTLIPAEIKQESEVMLIDAMFQAGKMNEVQAKLTAAIADAKTPAAQKERFKVYLLGAEALAGGGKVEEAIKKLDDVIAKNADPAIKAVAYNVMGDVYMQKQLPRDAMWSYLWVDVVYSQDKAEHMKAMSKLLHYFETEKDAEKVQMYKDKMARFK